MIFRRAAHQEMTAKTRGKLNGALIKLFVLTSEVLGTGELRRGRVVGQGTARAAHSGSHEIFGSWRAPNTCTVYTPNARRPIATR